MARYLLPFVVGIASVGACAAFQSGDGDRPGEADAAVGVDVLSPEADGSPGARRRCRADAPFGTIENVDELNAIGQNFSPSLSKDEREIFWVRYSPADGSSHVMHASRPTAGGSPFTEVAPMPELDISGGANGVFVTSTLAAAIVVSKDLHVYHLTGMPPDGKRFGAAVPVEGLGRATANSAKLRFDGAEIVFHTAATDAGLAQIFSAVGDETKFDGGVLFNRADPSALEGEPVLSADGLTLYFASARAGGAGSYDVWRTTRSSLSSEWETPIHVPELSGPAGDNVGWVSEDDCVVYFVRRAADASNARAILRARRGN